MYEIMTIVGITILVLIISISLALLVRVLFLYALYEVGDDDTIRPKDHLITDFYETEVSGYGRKRRS